MTTSTKLKTDTSASKGNAPRARKTGTLTVEAKATSRDNTTRANAATHTIPLKQVIDDIFKDTKKSLDPKNVRAKLRVHFRGRHAHMTNWTFDKAGYDEVRSLFDEAYKAKLAGAEKPKKARTPKAKKVTTEAEVIETPKPIDAVVDGEPNF